MSHPAPPDPGAGPPSLIRCDVTGDFPLWLSRAGGSLAITTYQAGKVVLVGWDGRQVTVLARDFDQPMGLAVDGPRLALATRHQVIFFANAPVLAHEFLEGQPGRYDALYLPRAAYHCGELNVHDIAFGPEGLWLVNTRFSCLSTLSLDCSFVPRWRPPFVTETVPEDRCHLNGLALADDRPKYATALGRSDAAGAWREAKATGGVILDIESDEVLVGGLCMPHSPRIHNEAVWFLNSGAGELCRIGIDGRPEVVCALPGYLRGLCFAGPFALVGMSTVREKHIFGGLPVQGRHPRLRCGVAVVDTDSGRHVGSLEFTEGCTELYDVQFLPGACRPMILNDRREETRQALTAPDFAYWLRPGAGIPPGSAPPP
jgi:uncharacterized protein (TIGR03032 family)